MVKISSEMAWESLPFLSENTLTINAKPRQRGSTGEKINQNLLYQAPESSGMTSGRTEKIIVMGGHMTRKPFPAHDTQRFILTAPFYSRESALARLQQSSGDFYKSRAWPIGIKNLWDQVCSYSILFCIPLLILSLPVSILHRRQRNNACLDPEKCKKG
jgi:hypothetical protein